MTVKPNDKTESSNSKRISIDRKKLRKLLFWAHVGTLHSVTGSYQKEIPKIIVEYMKKLNLKSYDFCSFKEPEFSMIARDVYVLWSDTIGKGK